MAIMNKYSRSEVTRFLRTETTGGIVLLIATFIGLVLANTALRGHYEAVRDLEVGTDFLHLKLTIGAWVKDGLLAVFFFVVGLELKREFVVGELRNPRVAALPVVAAVGGMVVPALVALSIAWGEPGYEKAWAVPMATDIAFALGVLAVTGTWMPTSARVFLLSLAVVDDLGAILVIAVVFTEEVNFGALLAAAALLGLYAAAQRARLRTSWLYVPLAIATWAAVHGAGVHATIAGVALGLLTRVKADPGEHEAPAVRLEHRLQPYSAWFVVPAFATFAAGVPLNREAMAEVFTNPVPLGIMAGLVVGKVVGIVAFSAAAVRLRWGVLPRAKGWLDITAIGMLGGVGFTVSLLIAELGLPPGVVEPAKAAVLIASLTSALLAAGLLLQRSAAHRKLAQSGVPAHGEEEQPTG